MNFSPLNGTTLNGSVVSAAADGVNPDPGRSNSIRLGPVAGDGRTDRNGPDPSRASSSRVGPDPYRESP